MGAIAGEEWVQWEKMRAASAREEKIFVLVRLRPLSEKEKAASEVSEWECINEETVLFRNTLQERSMFPTAYSFDRVFRGDCSTKQVYEEGAKDIALSVVSGINSCIFAYGQTSSGKTYTMVGITEYTVADIYDYMNKHEERAFVLKFSAMEIYNEAVRDLLSTDITPLRILDDPEKGTIIEKLTEEKLRDWSHLKKLLSICEAQRQIGETSLNETSSRSHQIIRLTMESSAREFLGKDKSSTLAASVNFVDLAGSERASQAFSAGQRLKEGCHINRSLLTLGTVIRKLSKGRQGHVNYRDSKLTRILQPCLGGNARTAIICTICSARSHVEQSRNTLLFASCAKEVTTNAQVNVVMSDKVLVKHLQRELARLESELRTPGPAPSACDCAAILRKKDLRIEKLEEENRQLAKQRDLAESRVQDLLQVLGGDQASKLSDVHTWEEDCSTSELSSVAYNHRQHLSFRSYNSEEPYSQLPEDSGNRSLSDGGSSPISIGSKFVKSDRCQGNNTSTPEDPVDLCKEVRCVETESPSLSTGENEEFSAVTVPSSNGDREEGRNQTGFTYGLLEQNIQDMQKTIQSLVSPYPDESSASDQHENTPPNGVETNFTGRPQSVRRRFPAINYDSNKGQLSRNNSESSIGSSIDELKARNISTSTDEDVTSIQTFVEGLKEMAKVQYEKQLLDGHQVTEPEPNSGKNSKDVGLDPMHDVLETRSDWPLEFERRQRAVIELWQTCNVSLVHRTYFFLLFKGDPSDSIYMEVELRRLSFLKQAFSQGNQAVNDGDRTLTVASSMKALRREREMLSKLIYKRFSEGERKRLYQKWGIGLDSKRRRMQLVDRLWSEPKDMNHVTESAVVVAKLVRFFQQGQALKEMFGLSFAHPRTRRRSFGWKQSSETLL